jgi:hypothetical protein
MPFARQFDDALMPGSLLHFLVHGELPERGRADDHLLDVRLLQRRVLDLGVGRPGAEAVLDELRQLAARHRSEIQAASPPGAAPWVVTKLREHGRPNAL